MVEMIARYPQSFLPDCFLLLAIVVGIVSIRYLGFSLKVMLLMLVLCFLVELVLLYYAAYSKNNHFLINLTSFIETVCLTVIYYHEVAEKRSRLTIIAALLMYLVAFVYSFSWMRIADHLLSIERFILILFVVLHFQYILSGMRVPNILVYSMFWISAGLLVYAAGTFFVFLFTKFTLSDLHGDFHWYISIVRLFTCLFYLVVAVAFYLQRRERVMG